MKRTLLKAAVALFGIVTLLSGCSQLEQPTMEGRFFRFATVVDDGIDANLDIDLTGEKFKFTNFWTSNHAKEFNVRNGNRVVAGIEYHVIGANGEVQKFSVASLDTVGISNVIVSDGRGINRSVYIKMTQTALADQVYPALWANGTIINMQAMCWPVEDYNLEDINFTLELDQINSDTMKFILRPNLTEMEEEQIPEMFFFMFDVASIRQPQATTRLDARRDSLLKVIDRQLLDSVYLTVSTCDTLVTTVDGKDHVVTLKGKSYTTRIPKRF